MLKITFKAALVLGFSFGISACSTSKTSLKIVSWNAEHLAYPISSGCRPRSQAELISIRAYVAELDADIVALQEIASESAARLLFPASDWNIVMSKRSDSKSYVCRGNGRQSTQQKVAFAVKKSVSFISTSQADEFGLEMPGLRLGLIINVDTQSGPVELLNLHLKSGCFVDDYQSSDNQACRVFAEQATILDAWLEQRELNNAQYVILGDLNHRISAPYNRLTQNLRVNQDGADSSIIIATEDLIGCHPRYPAPIDHIIVGGKNNQLSPSNAKFHLFDNMLEPFMLSDHCAVSIELESKPATISQAVKWQSQSKEYKYITAAIYQQTSSVLADQTKPKMPWVVVMDIDEIILDNSPYQVILDSTLQTYSTPTWNAWVQSEKAKLVPGSASFIETVIAHGGKLALITNREKSLDAHTWSNLLATGLAITTDNTCLIGRTPEDVKSIDGISLINDKDLRRQ
jgi:endonuclease/exonuclease/phosphatase family metal-dependent hydrolase